MLSQQVRQQIDKLEPSLILQMIEDEKMPLTAANSNMPGNNRTTEKKDPDALFLGKLSFRTNTFRPPSPNLLSNF